jgi:hypothetical protein
MLGGTVDRVVIHEDGFAVNSDEQEPTLVRRGRCLQSLAGRLFTRACCSVTRLSALRAEPLQALNRLPLYPRNLDRDLMSSCRLPMTFSRSMADRGWGAPVSPNNIQLAGLRPLVCATASAPVACQRRS